MKRLCLFLLLSLLLPIFGKAQDSYYKTATASFFGINIIDDGDLNNCHVCTVESKEGEIHTYTPEEVSEYSFSNRHYYSREISINGSTEMVFLEKLISGKNSLYYYKGKGTQLFFIEKDGSLLIAIPKWDTIEGKRYRNILQDVMYDCFIIDNSIRTTFYNKHSMEKLVQKYNECKKRILPSFLWGITAGWEMMKLNPPSDMQKDFIGQFNYTYHGSITAGIFIEVPLFNSDISLNVNPYISKHGYSYYQKQENKDLEMVTNLVSLKLPLMIKYTFPINSFQPFIMGGALTYFNLRNEMTGYRILIDENIHEIARVMDKSLISTFQFGYSVGGGVVIPLNNRNSLSFKISYDLMGGKSSSSINTKAINFSTAFIFY